MSTTVGPSEEDIITQLQGQVVLLTSQFYNCSGYIQKEAPPLGEPLVATEANGYAAPADFQASFTQCVEETIQTALNINQLIDALPEPRNRTEVEIEFERLASEAEELDITLRKEVESSDEMLQLIRESLRSVTKELLR